MGQFSFLRRPLLTAACAAALAGPLAGNTARAEAATAAPTFSKDVAPILYDNCVKCHRPDAVAPMSLRNYAEARPWARSIKQMVSTKQMPPWGADPAHGKFSNDASLTPAEIETIVKWADADAPEGNAADLPKLPEFKSGWQLGEPDLIIELPEIQIPATGPDYFPRPQVKLDVPEGKWVRAAEVIPGNRVVNHHIVLFMTGSNMATALTNFDILTLWAVGTPPLVYPEGMGRRVSAGQTLEANMHFHPNGTAQTDKSVVGLYFGEGELKKEINAALAGNFTFNIPPGAKEVPVNATWVAAQDIKVISYFPHMHMRGKDMKFTVTYPNGSTDTLLSVPDYDFNWQMFYFPENGLVLPKGSRVDIAAHFDNSAENKRNPDATKALRFGQESTDEMMIGLFEYIAVDGAKPAPVTDAERMKALLSSYPADSAFSVQMGAAGMTMPGALYLPKTGEGTLHLTLRGLPLSMPLKDLKWEGNSFESSIEIGLMPGAPAMPMIVKGTIGEDGTLKGSLDSPVPQAPTAAPAAAAGARGGAGGGGIMALLRGEFSGTRYVHPDSLTLIK